MAYPADSGTLPTNMSGTTSLADTNGDDHGLMHRQMGTVLNAVTSKIGLPAGTPAANQLLVGSGAGTAQWNQIWNGGTLGTATINNSSIGTSTIGTSTITGGTANNLTLGTPIVIVGSDATGDMFYRSPGGTINRVGIGSNNQVLTTNGTVPSWGRSLNSGLLQFGTQTTTVGTSSTSGTSYVDISSLSVINTGTINLLSLINIIWYNSGGTGALFGRLTLDGTILGNDPIIQFDTGIGTTTRALTMGGQSYNTAIAGGTHSLKLQGKLSIASGVFSVNAVTLTALAYNV